MTSSLTDREIMLLILGLLIVMTVLFIVYWCIDWTIMRSSNNNNDSYIDKVGKHVFIGSDGSINFQTGEQKEGIMTIVQNAFVTNGDETMTAFNFGTRRSTSLKFTVQLMSNDDAKNTQVTIVDVSVSTDAEGKLVTTSNYETDISGNIVPAVVAPVLLNDPVTGELLLSVIGNGVIHLQHFVNVQMVVKQI
jgi:flagellar basal body-associated protein FliL